MNKLTLFICAGALLIATGVLAQADPQADMIGIYFDEEAYVTWTEVPVGETCTAYLCLTRISWPSGISGWECHIEYTPSASVLEWNYRGDGINALIPPEFCVGIYLPLPWAPSIVVMDFLVLVTGPEVIEFTVRAADNPSIWLPCPLPVYAPGDYMGELQTLGYSGGWDGCYPDVCANINGGPMVVPAEAATWGTVKTIYR